MDEALGQEDARLLVTLQGGPVVVPADAGVIAQVAGRALEGQSVTLEHHLAQGRDEVVRVQLQGPFCGRRQGRGGVHVLGWEMPAGVGPGPLCLGATRAGERGRRRKPLEMRAQRGTGRLWTGRYKCSFPRHTCDPKNGTR